MNGNYFTWNFRMSKYIKKDWKLLEDSDREKQRIDHSTLIIRASDSDSGVTTQQKITK